jgi:hypothetical protein
VKSEDETETTVTIEVTTLAELRRYQRRELIRDLETIVGAAKSGPDHVRLRRLFTEAGIIITKRERP